MLLVDFWGAGGYNVDREDGCMSAVVEGLKVVCRGTVVMDNM